MRNAIGVLVNDPHLNKDNGELVKSVFKQVVSVCKKYDTDNVFCGGDVFTSRSGQPLSCLTDWKDILTFLGKKKINLHVIPGNHDKTDRDSERSYLDVFYGNYFHLYRNATVVNFDGVDVCFIPYFGDERWMEEFEKVKKEIDYSGKTVLITHMGFDGVMNNDGTAVVSPIKPSLFKRFTKVLIGHYHNASRLSKNVFYTGSAYQNNYGETVDDKGCTVIYDDGSVESVPLEFPRYIKEVLDVNDKEALRNLIDKYSGQEGNHVRLVFRGKRVDANKVDLSELSSKGFEAQFQAVETEEAIQVSEEEAVMCYDKKSILKDFVKFCSENSIKGKYLKYGMNLIKEL